MARFLFRKLVRDKIVDAQIASGARPSYYALTDAEHKKALVEKLTEEGGEILGIDEVRVAEEIADVQQVLDDLKRLYGVSDADIKKAQKKKNDKYGPFEKGLYVEDVILDGESEWANYYRTQPDRYIEVDEKEDSMANATASGDSVELERTFLARALPAEIAGVKGKEMVDVYVPDTKGLHPVLRIRRKYDTYEITKKQPVVDGDASIQNESTIVLNKGEYEALIRCSSSRVTKIRYNVTIDGYDAEVDVFQEDLEGLVLIDFEFDTEQEKDAFEAPKVCLADVTQEETIAGGYLAGKTYADIANKLKTYGYAPIT